MYICSQKLLSVSLSEYSVIKREFNRKRSVPSIFMSDIDYFVITSDIIKSFDCRTTNTLQNVIHENTKRRGPSIDPCETPGRTSTHLENLPLKTTRCLRPER